MKNGQILLLCLGLFSLESYAGLCRPDVPLHCVSPHSFNESFNHFKKVLTMERKAISKRISGWRVLAKRCPDESKQFDKEEKKLERRPLPVPPKSLPGLICNESFDCVLSALKTMNHDLQLIKDRVESEKKKVQPVLKNLKKIASECNVKKGKMPL